MAANSNTKSKSKAPKKSAAPAPVRRASFSRDKILTIATRMFAERGFAAISIRDIAGACGISIPSIYHFFGDKESLYTSCYEYTFKGVAQQIALIFTQPISSQARVKEFTIALCDAFISNHDFRRLLQREILREERRAIDQLTTHHFSNEFAQLTGEIAKLRGQTGAVDHAFSIYALAFGLIQLRRIGELAGMNKSIANDPKRLAEHVLGIVLPNLSWTD